MRYTTVVLANFLALILASGTVSGQVEEPTRIPSSLLSTAFFPIDTAPSDAPSWKGRILSGLATAAVGAGIGFFASQVATGDWDEGDQRGRVDRSRWAAVGGAGGFVLGLSIPVWGRAPGGHGQLPFQEDRFVISGDQIREESLPNALEAVRFFHPEWLVHRGQEAIYDPNADNIRVYLDYAQLTGVDDLAAINSLTVESIRFFDSRQATARWGSGHTHGAIQVITRGPESTGR